MYLQGISRKNIKVFLDTEGVKPKRSNTWNLQTILNMLNNRVYIGEFTWIDKESEEEFKIVLPQIISHSLFNRVHKKIKKNIKKLWKQFKSEKCITTYLLQRRLHADNLTEMNAPKLFNYYLQALETESNVLILKEVFKVMSGYKSKLVLYTYDSFTFDFDPSDGEQFFTDIKNAMKYPVKGQIGDTYNTLESLVFEHAI